MDDDDVCDSEVEGYLCLQLSAEEKKVMWASWTYSLIVKSAWLKSGFGVLKRRLHQLWARRASIEIADLGHDFFLIKFNNEEDFQSALLGRPSMIGDNYLSVREWQSNFDPAEASSDKIIAWVRFMGCQWSTIIAFFSIVWAIV